MAYLDDAVNASEQALTDSYRRNPVVPNTPVSQGASGIIGGYAPSLNDQVAASQRVLDQSFRNNPVVPNSAAPSASMLPTAQAASLPTNTAAGRIGAARNVDYSTTAGVPTAPIAAPAPDTGPLAAYGDPASGAMIGTYAPDTAGPGNARTPNVLDAINNFFRPDSTSARSYRAQEAIIDPSAQQPRAPAAPPAPAGQSIGVPQSVGVPYSGARTLEVYGGGPLSQAVGGADPLANTRAALAAYAARDAQDLQDRRNSMLASAAAASAATDLTRQQGDARVANWNREMARLDLAGNIGAGLSAEEAALNDAGKAADAANAQVTNTQARIDAANKEQQGTRNYLDEFAKAQQALNRTQLTNAQSQTQGVDLATKQVGLEQQRQLLDLQKRLATETDPKKRLALQNEILAIHGKAGLDKVAVVDIDTGQKDMLGQPIYKKAAINVQTGELVGGNTAAPAAGKFPAPMPQTIALLKANPTPDARKQFDAFYGPGAADAALK